MEGFTIIIIVLILGLASRLIAGSLDGDRVEEYLRERGFELLNRSWDPFGPGWFGEKNARIYQVIYRDREGSTHQAHVKTSMFSGVYLHNDSVIARAKKAETPMPEATISKSLEEEKRELKARLAEIENLEQKGK